MIFYGGVGAGKTYLSTLIGINAIQKYGKRVKFYTVASLANELLEANEKGTLTRLFNRIDKLDLLILDELGYIPLHKQGAELLFQVLFQVIYLCVMKNGALSLLPITEHYHYYQSSIRTVEPCLWRSNSNGSRSGSPNPPLPPHILFGGESKRMKESMMMKN